MPDLDSTPARCAWHAATCGVGGTLLIAAGLLWLAGAAPVAAQKTLPTAPAGAWIEVPGSRLDSVLWRDGAGKTVSHLKNSGSPENIMAAWNGAAYDEERDRLIIPAAGGDGDYAGNEVYVFHLLEGVWRRETDPTIDLIPPNHDTKGRPPCVYKDERGHYPCSRHTYNGVVYMPPAGKVWVGGGSRWWAGAGIVDAFLWSLETKQWEYEPADPTQSYDLGYVAAWDSVKNRVLYLDYTRLRAWTPGAAPGSRVRAIDDGGQGSDSFNRFYTAVFDPKRNRFVMAGPRGVVYFDLAQRDGSVRRRPIAVTGGQWPQLYAPGFAYDSVNDRYAAYGGGNVVYFIDPESGRLTVETGGGVTMTPMAKNGTFGRFRFSRTQGVFLVVNRIDETVRLYRPQAGGSG
jgi:hypothetical protein